MIPIHEEPKEYYEESKVYEHCYFCKNLQILGIMEQTNQFVKIVQKNIKYLNCKNHHQIMNRSRFPLVYNLDIEPITIYPRLRGIERKTQYEKHEHNIRNYVKRKNKT